MSSSRPIRVLVVGELGTARAEPFTIRRGELNAVLAAAAVSLTAQVEDRLGIDRLRTFELSFPKLRAFSIDALVGGTPLLHELSSLAEHVSAKQILPGVERLLGRGRLHRALEAADRAGQSEPPAAANARDASLEDLLRVAASAGADREKAAARALDIFVRVSRDKPAPAPVPVVRKPPRAVHTLLEETARQTAADLLSSPTVATLERAWRGLKLLTDQLPDNGSVVLEVADVRRDYELDVLQMREHAQQMPRPDLIMLSEPVASIERVRAFAEHAERLEAVCVLGLDSGVLGTDRIDALRNERDGALERKLLALRRDQSTRWLCLAVNPVLLHSEPRLGDTPRLVFGSAAWATTALLFAAQRDHQRFTRLLAPDTLLKAPTFWIPDRGADAGMALPTAQFCSIRAQTELEALGLATLGSTRRGDEVLMSRAPTAFAGDALQSLPSQLVIGRLVRAARQARALIAEQGDDASHLARAARIVEESVPAGLERVVKLDVSIERDERKPRLAIKATADRFEGLSAFAIAFTLEC